MPQFKETQPAFHTEYFAARAIVEAHHGKAGDNWRASSFRLLLRTAKDVSVLQPPGKDSSDQGALVTVLLVIVGGLLVWIAALRLKMRGAARRA